MSGAAPDQRLRRRRAALVVRSLLAAAWFAFVFFVCFPAAVLWWTGAGWIPPAGVTRWLGGAVVLAAHLVLAAPLRRFIVDGDGSHAPLDPPRRLVATGLHARVRNPMYLLYVVVVLGEALIYRSWPLCAYALALWGVAHGYVVLVEEKALRRRFGPEYDDYAGRVGRWLPRGARRNLPVGVRSRASRTRNSRGTL